MKGRKNMTWTTLYYLTKDNKTLMLYRNKKIKMCMRENRLG